MANSSGDTAHSRLPRNMVLHDIAVNRGQLCSGAHSEFGECQFSTHRQIVSLVEPLYSGNGYSGLGSDSPETQIFHFNVIVHPILRTFAPPNPDSFIPPNGATSVEIIPVLIPTIPYSSASATFPHARDVASVKICR